LNFTVKQRPGCLLGKGVVKDEQKATQRLRLAARQGLAEAQHHLGMDIYSTFREKTIKLIRKAVRQGYAHAIFSLGLCYSEYEGIGVRRDPRLAVKLYHTAARSGVVGASIFSLYAIVMGLK